MARSWPVAAHTNRPLSWSTTTIRYLCRGGRRSRRSASAPARRRIPDGPASVTTRPAIAPTLRQATRMNSTTADFEQCVTSQATWSSKARCDRRRGEPTHRRHRHPMIRTRDPRHRLDEHPQRAGIQRSPPSPPLTLVVAAAAPPALTAATRRTPAEPTRHHDLVSAIVELDRLDDHVTFDADHASPYPLDCTPLALALFPAVAAGKPSRTTGAPADGQLLTHERRRARKRQLSHHANPSRVFVRVGYSHSAPRPVNRFAANVRHRVSGPHCRNWRAE